MPAPEHRTRGAGDRGDDRGRLVTVSGEWVVNEIRRPRPALPRSTRGYGCSRAAGLRLPPKSALVLGELVIDEATYSARLRGRLLALTYKEFELLKYLARHAGQVFTRAQLLQEVWGYDFFGGTRTVDVHVRRLRAKLGTEHEQMIGTVRNVGYKLVRPSRSALGRATAIAAGPEENDDADQSGYLIPIGNRCKRSTAQRPCPVGRTINDLLALDLGRSVTPAVGQPEVAMTSSRPRRRSVLVAR